MSRTALSNSQLFAYAVIVARTLAAPFQFGAVSGWSSHIHGTQILNTVLLGGFVADPQGRSSPRRARPEHSHDRAAVSSPVTTCHNPGIPPFSRSAPRKSPRLLSAVDPNSSPWLGQCVGDE